MTFINPVYSISKDCKYIIVSDMYSSDYPGGAELTLDSTISACPEKYIKLYCDQITEQLISNNKDKYWIIANHSRLSKDRIIELATSGIAYSVIVCDYFYCKYRSSHLHELTTKSPCDCHMTDQGKFILGFYKRAQKVFFMSDGHLNEHKRLFPIMNKWPENKLIVQGSTFDNNTLSMLKELGDQYPIKNGKWAIQGSSNTSWIKNTDGCVQYCIQNNLPYEIIGGLSPKDFLNKLAQYKGLVFIPKGFDTNPRITIESRLLGLELILGDLVQNKNDNWFNLPVEQLYDYLSNKANDFWIKIKQ